jgi:hypothetical protein
MSPPSASTAIRHRRASAASSIFRFAIARLRYDENLPGSTRDFIPASLMGHDLSNVDLVDARTGMLRAPRRARCQSESATP